MTIGTDLGFALPRPPSAPDDTLVLPTGLIGLEFEYENISTIPNEREHDWAVLYTRHEDHSLRGNAWEFVFSEPLFGKDVTDAIRGLTTFSIQAGWTVGLRTGLHVHVDIRDLEYPQLQTLILVSAFCDAALYHFAGDNREENVFCLPWYTAERAIEDARGIYTSKGDALQRVADTINRRKYSGFNLDPISRFGSVEYRHLRCTSDYNRIIDWVNVLLRFKEFAKRWDKAPEAMLDYWQSMDFWGEVLKEQLNTLRYEGFLADMERKCLPVVRGILLPERHLPPRKALNTKVQEKIKKKAKTKNVGDFFVTTTTGPASVDTFIAELATTAPTPTPQVVNTEQEQRSVREWLSGLRPFLVSARQDARDRSQHPIEVSPIPNIPLAPRNNTLFDLTRHRIQLQSVVTDYRRLWSLWRTEGQRDFEDQVRFMYGQNAVNTLRRYIPQAPVAPVWQE